MKKKHQKFKPLRELYDRDDTLLKSKDVDLLKASPESTIDQALVVDPSQDRKGDSHGKLSSSEVSNIPSTSCQSSFSDDLQSLDSLKSPGYSKDLPMLQIAITSQTTVKRQDQDVFDCQGDNSSCISKDDGAAMISTDQYGGEDHKIVTSRAVSVSSPCPDVLEKSLNVLSISKGSPIASTQDPCLQNQNLMHEDRADEPDELVDVRICDICGDAGREASLALCSKCSDGAEHIYCMSPKMDKVPEGDWFCEECLLMQDPKRQRQVMMEGPDDAPNSSRIQEPSQGSPTIISAIHHDGKMKTNHSSKASCSSDKRPGLAIDMRSKAKKGIDDRSAQPLKISDSGGNSRLTHRSSLKNMNEKKNAARQVSSFVVPDNKMVKQGSSEHRSSKPEQQSCGGSFTDKKIVDSSVSNLEVQHSREDIHQRRRSTEDKADCELKKDHPDKKVVESLSLTGASSMPPEVSNMQSSVSNIKGVRYGNKSNIAEKNCSLESKTNQVDFPSAGSSPTNVRSSCAKVAPQIGKAASSPIKSFEDKSAIQVNGNTNVEAFDSLALEGKSRVNTSAGSIEESNSPNRASYVINSPAKNVNAYPDLRMSLSTQKAELAEIKRNNNDVSSFTVQHMKVKPTIDPVNLDHMAPNLTSAVPESRCIWRGTFSLEKSGKLPTDCYGVQAHLSTRASSKIADLVLKFSDELLLKEVPRLHTWPIQFQKNNPNEQDIALYFFAQDLCSYERSYRMLLEGMSTNDIALEANFGGFQLLVFPSSLLPARSHRWNSLPFLWGVFRIKIFDDSRVPDLNVVTVNQGVSSPATCGSQSKFVSALLSGSSALTSYSSMHGPESAKPVALPSLALVTSKEQSIEHELPPLNKHIATLKYHDFQADAITPVRDWSKEDSGGGLYSYDLQKNNTFSDNDIKGPMKTDIIPCGQLAREHTAEVGFRSDSSYKDMGFTASELRQGHDVFSGNSFSLDSGPSGSSDGGECAKSAVELQIEPSENPRRYNTLNLNHCLDNRSGSEELDLDLALGFPSKSDYEPEITLNDGIDRDGDVSLVLSLGMPCSTS